MENTRPKSTKVICNVDMCEGVFVDRNYYDVKPAVNRQPGFRRELVEQITPIIIRSQKFLHGELLKCKFPDPENFVAIFHENSKISSFFQHFGEEAAHLKTKV